MEEAKPRVNGAMIAKYVGKRVTIVGRYVSVSKSIALCIKLIFCINYCDCNQSIHVGRLMRRSC